MKPLATSVAVHPWPTEADIASALLFDSVRHELSSAHARGLDAPPDALPCSEAIWAQVEVELAQAAQRTAFYAWLAGGPEY